MGGSGPVYSCCSFASACSMMMVAPRSAVFTSYLHSFRPPTPQSMGSESHRVLCRSCLRDSLRWGSKIPLIAVLGRGDGRRAEGKARCLWHHGNHAFNFLLGASGCMSRMRLLSLWVRGHINHMKMLPAEGCLCCFSCQHLRDLSFTTRMKSWPAPRP